MKIPKRLKGQNALLALSLVPLLSLCAFAETVEIRNAADWNNFAKRVNDKQEVSLNAVLMRNVTLDSSSLRVGFPQNRAYRGNFDGNGKTLTVAIKVSGSGSDNPAAPFPFVTSGANIHDLHVAGTIQTDGKFAGGIFGRTESGSDTRVYLTRCQVSAAITCTINGDSSTGGFFGMANISTPSVEVRDCLFDGSLLGASTINCGGFVGWRSAANVWTYNCLFNPSQVTLNSSGSFTLVRPSYSSPSSQCSNTYYTKTFGEAQGASASGKTAAQLVALLGSDWQVVSDEVVPKFHSSGSSETIDPNSGALAFTYQGLLRDSAGNVLSSKSHTIAFRIYDQATGGSPHWGRQHSVKLDDAGNFAVEISDFVGEAINGVPGTGLSDVLTRNASSTLYLGLTIDNGEVEISPRQKIVSAPMASQAGNATVARRNFNVAGNVTAKGARITETVNAPSFSTTNGITGRTLTTSGNATVSGNLNVSGTISTAGVVPIGAIIPWQGTENSVPDGWAVCNGSKGTPDLRGRFIVATGAYGYSVGSVGGENTHKLTVAEMPSHDHDLYARSLGYEDKRITSNEVLAGWYQHMSNGSQYLNDTELSGGDQRHENRPPYYALLYIMRIK